MEFDLRQLMFVATMDFDDISPPSARGNTVQGKIPSFCLVAVTLLHGQVRPNPVSFSFSSPSNRQS
jgi:hypothetical protein